MARVTTRMLVDGVLAAANRSLVTAVLEERGSAESGAILVRLDQPDGNCRIESRVAGMDGGYEWQDITGDAPLDAEAARERIKREKRFDPDLWVIAVDASLSGNPFKEG